MALIQCPECKSEVSDKASSCPKCGCPISIGKEIKIQNEIRKEDGKENAQTIQLTGKKYKAQQLLGVVALLLGLVILMAGLASNGSGATVFGTILMVGGLIWYLVARILAWWQHG